MTLVSFKEIEKITAGNKEVMRGLLELFIRQNTIYVNDIEIYFKMQNWSDLKKVSHKLKSSLALIGMLGHRALAEKLEHIAGYEISETQKLVDELVQVTRLALVEIESKLKEIS